MDVDLIMTADVISVAPIKTSSSDYHQRRRAVMRGNLRSRVTKLTTEEIRANPPRPPLIGACVVRDFPAVQKLYPKVRVALNRAQFVCWQVSAE